MTTLDIRANKAKALARILRLCSDLERRAEAEVLGAMREYIAATDAADAEIERIVSETGAIVGAADTAEEARIAVSKLITFMRTGRAPRRERPRFALVGGRW